MRLSLEDSDVFGRKIESGSITSQRRLIMDFIKRQPEFDGCKVIERCDDGLSGRYFDTRPQFTDMIEQAKKGRINCIIVKDCSRFGRDYVELGDYLEQLFPFLGVRFIAVNDNYDSSKTEGGLDIAFKNLVYDVYSRDLSKKVKASRRQMALQGKYTAAQTLYGYRKKKTDKHSLELNEETAPVVREIFDMRLSGMGLLEIARNLNERGIKCPSAYLHSKGETTIHKGDYEIMCWSGDVVENILRNEIYTGAVVSLKSATDRVTGKLKAQPKSEWIRVERMHDAIVTKEEFQKVQEIFKPQKPPCAKRKIHYRCGICGRALNRRNVSDLYCYRGYWHGDDCECRKVTAKETELDEIVLDELKRKLMRVLDAEELKLETSSGDCGTDSVKAALDAVKKEKQMLFEKLADRRIEREAFKARKAEIDAQIAELEQRIEDAKVSASLAADAGSRADETRSFLDAESMTEDIWERFVKDVRMYPEERMEIIWNFDAE
jgi:DNA invertase Pin-like site-specific DNA recombinase